MNQELEKIQYVLSSGLRVSQFLSQSLLGSFVYGHRPTAEEKKVLPPIKFVLEDLKNLFEQDYENIRAGLYKMPQEVLPPPIEFTKKSFKVIKDFIRVKDRKNRKAVKEFTQGPPDKRLPTYFAQNFHYQTDGYLSQDSAELYDHQVELVFSGGADAMRRRALVPLYYFLLEKALPHQEISLLDIACGTGRFLASVKENYPDMHVTGVDLSPWYLKKARDTLSRSTRADFVEAKAEDLPFKDAQFDVVTCIYLFHELPRIVRTQVAKEMFRVLKPNGLLIFEDSLQLRDKSLLDASLRLFPKNYHEPYYADYIDQNLVELFSEAGFVLERSDLAFFSKIQSFRKLES